MTQRTISARTITRDTERAAKFLGGISRSRAIWRILVERAGYTQAIHSEGWSKYLAVMGYRPPASDPPPDPTVQQEAIAQLDSWDAPAFERADAALSRNYPAQRELVFRGLTPAKGAAAVASVQTFLTRVDELRQGSKEDKAAAQLLAQRRILDRGTEDQLRNWIEAARQGSSDVDAGRDEQPEEEDDDLQAKAIELHDFLTDWRTQARNVISRRDYLIRLGLASLRRNPTTGKDEEVIEVDDE